MGKNDRYWAWSYVDQKFGGAAETLCTSFAPNWQRMHDALFQLVVLLPSHFPDKDLFDRYDALMDHATARGPLELNGRNYRGALENTLRRRKRSTLERYAKEVFDIHGQVLERRGSYAE